MSYVIGANIGDGSTLTKGWFVKLEVTDFDFAQAFNTNMAMLFSRVKPNKILVKRFDVERLPMFVVKYSSKQLVKLLRLPLKELLELAFEFPREFLRGFFDAEGHVDVGVSNRLGLTVGAENSNRVLLLGVKRFLRQLNITSRMYRKRKAGTIKEIRGEYFVMKRTSYSIVIGNRGDVRKFAETIGFSIHRKAQKLADALSIIATCKRRDRIGAWKRLYSKTRGEWTRRV